MIKKTLGIVVVCAVVALVMFSRHRAYEKSIRDGKMLFDDLTLVPAKGEKMQVNGYATNRSNHIRGGGFNVVVEFLDDKGQVQAQERGTVEIFNPINDRYKLLKPRQRVPFSYPVFSDIPKSVSKTKMIEE